MELAGSLKVDYTRLKHGVLVSCINWVEHIKSCLWAGWVSIVRKWSYEFGKGMKWGEGGWKLYRYENKRVSEANRNRKLQLRKIQAYRLPSSTYTTKNKIDPAGKILY
jgi:hypothetical protein